MIQQPYDPMKKTNKWLERLKYACGDSLTDDQKTAIIRNAKYVVWKKVDDDFESLVKKRTP